MGEVLKTFHSMLKKLRSLDHGGVGKNNPEQFWFVVGSHLIDSLPRRLFPFKGLD